MNNEYIKEVFDYSENKFSKKGFLLSAFLICFDNHFSKDRILLFDELLKSKQIEIGDRARNILFSEEFHMPYNVYLECSSVNGSERYFDYIKIFEDDKKVTLREKMLWIEVFSTLQSNFQNELKENKYIGKHVSHVSPETLPKKEKKFKSSYNWIDKYLYSNDKKTDVFGNLEPYNYKGNLLSIHATEDGFIYPIVTLMEWFGDSSRNHSDEKIIIGVSLN